jgi:hypothetical protein
MYVLCFSNNVDRIGIKVWTKKNPKGDAKVAYYITHMEHKFFTLCCLCQIEIITWTFFLPYFLDKEIIALLSALPILDSSFNELQDSMVYKAK